MSDSWKCELSLRSAGYESHTPFLPSSPPALEIDWLRGLYNKIKRIDSKHRCGRHTLRSVHQEEINSAKRDALRHCIRQIRPVPRSDCKARPARLVGTHLDLSEGRACGGPLPHDKVASESLEATQCGHVGGREGGSNARQKNTKRQLCDTLATAVLDRVSRKHVGVYGTGSGRSARCPHSHARAILKSSAFSFAVSTDIG